MQMTKMHKGRRSIAGESPHLLGSVLYGLMAGLLVFVILLFLFSLVEWFLPNAENELMPYIAEVIPLVGICLGTYLGSRRLGRRVLWFGAICGLICWLFALCAAWCIGIAATPEWMVISASICVGTALIGAMMGLLHTR